MSTTIQTFGDRARHLRKTAGLSTIETAYRIRDLLPESEWKSYQAIHRIEAGDTAEGHASPALLAAEKGRLGDPQDALPHRLWLLGQ